MNADLANLSISEKEVERLSGCDVGSIFIGGVFGGVCRSSTFRDPQRLLTFCLTEVVVFFLACVFTLPIALFTIRDATNGVSQGASTGQFLIVTVGMALVVMALWNAYLWLQSGRFKGLMHLLDDIDRFHEVIRAIALLDQLGSVSTGATAALQNRTEVLEALQLTRDSLIAGLMTEKLLRESRGLIARRQDLLSSIETNLATLKTLEIEHQADEYGQFLNQALQIGISVHQEMQKLSR